MIKNIHHMAISLITIMTLSGTLSISHASENIKSNGLIKVKSTYGVKQTINRLQASLKNKGMTIFKRIDHSAGASKAGLSLRPTELLIFGNPKAGTPLMLCSQTMAIDLPQKALAFEDENKEVWLVYNDPTYMAARHNTKECDKSIQKLSNALSSFAKEATR